MLCWPGSLLPIAAVSSHPNARWRLTLLTILYVAALGPLLSGFSVPAMHWRWSLFETIWASVPVLVLMFLFLPETSSEGILFQRAQRLSKLTGKQFVIRSHMAKTHGSRTSALVGALIKPIEISFKDPAMLFVQIYTSIIYGIYYSCKSTYRSHPTFL